MIARRSSTLMVIISFLANYLPVFIGVSLWFVDGSLHAATLKTIDFMAKDEHTVVVRITLSGEVSTHSMQLGKPPRLVLDVAASKLDRRWQIPSSHSRYFRSVRYAHQANGNLRVVFDLCSDQHFQQLQRRSENKQTLLTLQFNRVGSSTSAKPPTVTQLTSVPRPPSSASQSTQTSTTVSKLSPVINIPPVTAKVAPRKVRVVIDPGHGGHDPGALGSGYVQEKRVVLAIAKELQNSLAAHPGIEAVLTRQGDTYLGLRQRLGIARQRHADVFISIHADAFRDRSSRGVSVFALSQRGATSEAARWLAEKENHSELGEVDLSELVDDSGVLRSVLLDLSQTATIGASLHLGENLLTQLQGLTHLHHVHVEQARFVVLKSPDIPSVLVETGFISNQREALLLNSAAYQRRLGQLLSHGIIAFLKRYPPHNSVFAFKAQSYWVKHGDTLGLIAKHHHISLKTLCELNHLQAGRPIKVGQRLMIPLS